MRLLFALLLTTFAAWGQIEYTATSSSVELRYEPPGPGACRVEASRNPEMYPLVAAIDPEVAPGEESDERFAALQQGRGRRFRLGRRAGLIANDKVVPMWLEPDTTYYVRLDCEGGEIRGVVKTEPAGREADGGCVYQLGAAQGTFPAAGGTYNLSLTTSPGCSWFASTGATWLHVSPASGTGSATLTFVVDPNAGTQRGGSVWAATGGIWVLQQAGPPQPVQPCTVNFAASGSWFPALGGWYSLDVLAPPGCYWQVQSSSSWMRLTSASSGFGRATINYTVDRNTGAFRAGGLWMDGRTFTVNQLGGAALVCTPSLSSYSSWFPAGGGSYSIAVYVQPGCPWTASSSLPWVNIRSGTSGTGGGTVTLVMDANPYSTNRTGSITLAGIQFAITQTRGAENLPRECPLTLGAASAAIPFDAATHGLAVGAPAGCAWQGVTSTPWIQLTSASGTGAGTLRYTVTANTGGARTGTITIGTQTFTLTQAALTCSFRLSYLNSWFPSSGGAYTIGVTAPAGCAWIATSGASWLRLTSGATGTGNGVISFTTETNWSSARTTTISLAGQAAVINQSSGYVPVSSCTVSLNLTSSWFPMEGGSYSLEVGSPANCPWAATANASWVRLSNTTGAGPATLRFTLDPNTGPYRTAVIQVGGRTFVISQAALFCTYRLSFTSSWFPAAEGAYSIAVTAPTGCTWAASSGADWVRLTGAASGSGSAVVPLVIARNFSRFRSAVMYVAGQAVQIQQVGQ
ncbi:MAG: BACON domain-containing carbohydrate-binding protein [Bryobacteraceae bacterium]|nr:BACON domain-containing carbohydrate-binding protein [Bryobacteraceae bacterium]